jgi:hypothetical protein
MQRLRVGLTGLACVFLLVMLATAFLRMADGSEAGANAALTPSNGAAPSEPLAQLGVAPGNQPLAGPATAPTAVPAPTPTR